MNDVWTALAAAGLGVLGALLGGTLTAVSTLWVARISQDRQDQRVRREELKEVITEFYVAALETYRQELYKTTRVKNVVRGEVDKSKDAELRQARVNLVFARDRLMLFDETLTKSADKLTFGTRLEKKFIDGGGTHECKKQIIKDFKATRKDFIKEARNILGISVDSNSFE